VLRRGSWRPTRAHEYLFQLAKSPNYFCDMEAVREEKKDPADDVRRITKAKEYKQNPQDKYISRVKQWMLREQNEPCGRNLRDVWCIGTQAYPDAHYATFPEKLVEPCIKVGTSEKGCCPKCGAPWARIMDSNYVRRNRPNEITRPCPERRPSGNAVAGVCSITLGWLPTCDCGQGEAVPCTVLDPFMGSGTVAAVAARLGRNYIGIDINEEYIQQHANKRIAAAVPTVPLFAEAEK